MKRTVYVLRAIAPDRLEITLAIGVAMGFWLAYWVAPLVDAVMARVWVEVVWKRIF